MGWPRATAPPTGLSFSSGTSSSRPTAIAMEAKASFASTASRSSTVMPAFFMAILEAGIMPVPITEGSTPATAALTSLPAMGSPSSSAFFSPVTSIIAAPSLTPLALPAAGVGRLLAGDEHHRGPVVDAARVGRGDGATLLLEDRLELLEALDARVGADVLVGGELDRLFLLLDLDGHDLPVEELVLVGLGRPLVAPHSAGGGLLAGDAVLLGDVLGRNTHVVVVEDVPEAVEDHVVVHVHLGHAHPVAVPRLVQKEGRPVHVLDAAGHDDVGVAEGDLLGGGDNGLEARAAHPVQGQARGRHREPGLHPDLAAGVHALAGGEGGGRRG